MAERAGDQMEEAGVGDEEAEQQSPAVERDEAQVDQTGEADELADGAEEVNVHSFEELRLPRSLVKDAQDCWKMFITAADSEEAAGEAIYTALFEGAPSLQSLFVTPRAVQAQRFMNGLRSFVGALDDPSHLKILVESLGFGHLHLDVTIPRVAIFRDAILDLFQLELGDRFTSLSFSGWRKLLNYVGGAIIFVKAHYADRIACLLSSWKICNKSKEEDNEEDGDSRHDSEDPGGAREHSDGGKHSSGGVSGWGSRWPFSRSKVERKDDGGNADSNNMKAVGDSASGGSGFQVQNVPTTYPDMFLFNAAVMGFGQSAWMIEVLECFDDLVTNVANSARLQQECAILALRISKKGAGEAINMTEYKACMLASLRSLLPKDWDSSHEVAWTWLWENIERLVLTTHGKPPAWEKALGKFLDSQDEEQKYTTRATIYQQFFTSSPRGQDYFKQSNTYLHFIAERIIQMTMELFRDPAKMVDDLSALGLRHVGYGIPTDMFGPFVTACVEVIRTLAPDEATVESFRFSLGLISNILTRTITEGSTVVMKAINLNKQKPLKKAVACAPRGERAKWVLNVQVGSQSISPLSWSIESGSLESATAIIQDLLTIRADRERYYYGLDALFKRHADIVDRICTEAPAMLPTLLDGLIWRSCQTESSLRRVNYFVKHLLVDEDGNFSKTLEWITRLKDPQIVCHPVVILVSDLMWQRVVYPTFLYGKTWFLFTLMLFITSQSVLEYVNNGRKADLERTMVFACRAFIYLCSMTQLIYCHSRDSFKAFRGGSIFQLLFFWVPCYLKKWQETASLGLGFSLMVMLCLEPILRCHRYNDGNVFEAGCKQGDGSGRAYEFFSMTAMFLYYILLIDFAAVSTRISAYVLICIRMFSEVGLFLGAIFALMLTFSSAISVLEHDNDSFAGIAVGAYSLLRTMLRMFDSSRYDALRQDPAVFVMVVVFLVSSAMFLVSLFIAQLSCAYSSVYDDMVGYARLERGSIIVEMMPSVPKTRWYAFVEQMEFSKRLEFNAGDIGLAGGIQVREPANIHPSTIDAIRRFGGSTSQEMQWPAEEEGGENADADRFQKIENLMKKALTNVTKAHKKHGKSGHSGDSGLDASGMSGSSDGSNMKSSGSSTS